MKCLYQSHQRYYVIIRNVAETHFISFKFLIFLFNKELVLCNLWLDGAKKRAALVCVHWFILEKKVQHHEWILMSQCITESYCITTIHFTGGEQLWYDDKQRNPKDPTFTLTFSRAQIWHVMGFTHAASHQANIHLSKLRLELCNLSLIYHLSVRHNSH